MYSGMWICVGNYYVEKCRNFWFRFLICVLNFYFCIGVTGLTWVLDWMIFDTDFASKIIWEGN